MFRPLSKKYFKQVNLGNLIGWREWVTFPELGIDKIKAKIDTGARTSTLHSLDLDLFKTPSGKPRVRFKVYPEQYNSHYWLNCEADLLEQRAVKNSGGESEFRYIIKTTLSLGKQSWPIELTLTNRDAMGFRLLLGRTALKNRFLVNPSRSFLMARSK